jgi:plastocyanin
VIARRPGAAAAGLVFAALVLLGACGGGGGSTSSYKQPTGPAAATVDIDAGNYSFKPKHPTVPAGIVKIRMKNVSGNPHTLAISGVDGYQLSVSGGGSTDAKKVDLKPGTYTFYCTIPGHRSAGMEGKLTVT